MIFYLKTTHVQYLEVGLLSKIPLLLAIQQFGTCERKIQGFWTKLWTSYGPVLVHSTMHPPSSRPSFTNLSACSLPSMLTCALTLYNVIGCVRFWSSWTMVARVIWLGWLLWRVGCLICVLSRCNTFGLSVNMYAGSLGIVYWWFLMFYVKLSFLLVVCFGVNVVF